MIVKKRTVRNWEKIVPTDTCHKVDKHKTSKSLTKSDSNIIIEWNIAHQVLHSSTKKTYTHFTI